MASVYVQGGLCILRPPGRAQGDVPSLLTIDRRRDELCRLVSLQCVVFSLHRMRGQMKAFLTFHLHVVFVLKLSVSTKGHIAHLNNTLMQKTFDKITYLNTYSEKDYYEHNYTIIQFCFSASGERPKPY